MSSTRVAFSVLTAISLGLASFAPLPAQALCGDCKKVARGVGKAASKAANKTVSVAKDAVEGAGKAVKTATRQFETNLEHAAEKTDKAIDTAVHQAEVNASHAVEKVKTETTNFGQNTEEAFREGGRYLRRSAETYFDANMALLSLDPYEAQKIYINGSFENAVTAMSESSMLRVGGTVIAGAYGGPAAVGALNGVLVYKQTGDNGLAWKAGLISAASTYATGEISGFQASGAGEIAASAAANGVVTGASVAALDGDFEEGFKRGVAGSLANSYFQHVTGDAKPDERIPEGPAYPKDSTSADTLTDPGRVPSWQTKEEALALMDQIPRNRPWTGMESFNTNLPDYNTAVANNFFGVTEDSGFMMSIAKIPVVNPGSVFHDYLSVQNGWTTPMLQVTIPPAFAVTGIAMHLPEKDLIFDTAIASADDKKQ